MLEVEQVSRSYATPQGPLPVLREVSLSLAPGETAALVGESGSGKSTLLHLIAGLDRPDAGAIRVAGEDVASAGDAARAQLRRMAIGLIFQQFNLIPSLDVAANLAFQARIAGRLDLGWQTELTERLGLADLTDRYPEQLSGGQQQRVAIGRALAGRPGLLLADEPTGNLDGASLLMVTHSPRLAGLMQRRIELRAGRIVE
jgi:putative ABC transport system ATP-binding protein